MGAKPKLKPKSGRRAELEISVQEFGGMHRLMVRSLAGLSPAGWRLQRGAGFPISEFEFFDEDEARIAAVKLQEYLNES